MCAASGVGACGAVLNVWGTLTHWFPCQCSYSKDCLCFSHDKKVLDSVVTFLSQDFVMTNEGKVAKYLGVGENTPRMDHPLNSDNHI